MSKAKPWEKGPYKKSQQRKKRRLRDTILIICGGEKTEPNYFRAFPVKTDIVKVDIVGKGLDPKNLLNEALRIRKEKEKKDIIYNQVWLVIDKDEFKADDFNSVIFSADKYKIRVAYSNQAFELWYLLHFEYLNSSTSRKQYIKKLTQHLNKKYYKNDSEIYNDIIGKQDAAVQNAIKLKGIYDGRNPAKNDPSTTVHQLVETLNEFIDTL